MMKKVINTISARREGKIDMTQQLDESVIQSLLYSFLQLRKRQVNKMIDTKTAIEKITNGEFDNLFTDIYIDSSMIDIRKKDMFMQLNSMKQFFALIK